MLWQLTHKQIFDDFLRLENYVKDGRKQFLKEAQAKGMSEECYVLATQRGEVRLRLLSQLKRGIQYIGNFILRLECFKKEDMKKEAKNYLHGLLIKYKQYAPILNDGVVLTSQMNIDTINNLIGEINKASVRNLDVQLKT